MSVDEYEKKANAIFKSGDTTAKNKPDLNIKTAANQGFLPKKYILTRPASMSDQEFEKIHKELSESLKIIVEKYFTPQGDKLKFYSEEIEKKIIEANNSKTLCPTLLSEAKMECVNFIQKNFIRRFILATHEKVLSQGLIKFKIGLMHKIHIGLKTKFDQILLDELPFPYIYDGNIY
jgi:hypothetical protein